MISVDTGIVRPTYNNGFAIGSQTPFSQLWRGCVGAWCPSLGRTGATLRDLSGFANHGTLNAMDVAADWVIDEGGYALDFSGDADPDDVTINSVFGLSNVNLSITCWVNLDSTSEGGAFVKVGGDSLRGYAIGVGDGNFDVDGNELILLYEAKRFIATGDAIGTGWHFCAMSIDNLGVPEWYLDGVSGGTSSGTNANSPIVTDTTHIGGYTQDATQRYTDCRMDDVKIYNRKLTAGEMYSSYDLGRAGMYVPLTRRPVRSPVSILPWMLNHDHFSGRLAT